MVPADSRGIPRVPRYSGIPAASAELARKRLSRTMAALSSAFRFVRRKLSPRGPYNPAGAETPTVWAPPLSLATTRGSSPFARHYSGNHSYFLLLRVLRCFSSPRSPPAAAGCRLSAGGLPHSGTRGSRAACAYPRLFAACRALRRLWEPRHPPCAFSYFVHAPPPRNAGKGSSFICFPFLFQHVNELSSPFGDGGE